MTNKRKTIDTWVVNYDGLAEDYELAYQGYTNMYKSSNEAYEAALLNNDIASSNGIKIYFYVTYKRVRAGASSVIRSLEDSEPSKILQKRHGVDFL